MKGTSASIPAGNSAFDFFVPPLPQSGSSKIVFASNREGSMQIYVMNGDGSGVARLTNSGANDDFPRWSPNGMRILFQSDRDHPDTGYMDLYVMNPDGSGVVRLTTDANDDSMATWSPDGSKIVFQSMRNGNKYQVYVMNADGSNQICLTNTSSSDGEPSWSPNGASITFASDRDHAGYYSVYVMNSNGAGQQRLTFSASAMDDRQPAWSPDGAKIAFASTRDSTTENWTETDDFEIPEDDGQVITRSRLNINKEVYAMNADGSGQTRLTNELANDDSPSWSPDGSRIIFRSDRERDCCDPSAQIWTMNADGTSQTDLSVTNDGDYSASWATGVAHNDSQLASDYSSGNQVPIANAGGPYVTQSGQVVQLNGTGSFDPNGTIVSYSWNFGDGTSGGGAVVNHQYNAGGEYPVSLSVLDNSGNAASSQAFVTVDSAALPVKITFDELPNNITFTDQFQPYLNPYGVRFASGNFFYPVHTYQNCGFCSTTSQPNFISTKPDDRGQMIVTFAQPVSNLVFYAVGVDTLSGTFAFVDLYRNGSPVPSNTFAWNGVFSTTVGFSAGGFSNIDKVVIRGITDADGIGFDDFSFTVPADVKITSGRVNGYLNGTTQNALLGADVALNASPLPGAFSGGTYAWTCTPSTLCPILGSANSSSVTLRTNELGTFTANVSYTKNGITASSSMTIKSILPTLASFAARQERDLLHAPLTCGHPFPTAIDWWYGLGCYDSAIGISFLSRIQVGTYISDPNKSGIKYLQAVSPYSKRVSRGIRCDTRRTEESIGRPLDNQESSGWMLDTKDPYECCSIFTTMYFSTAEGLPLGLGHDFTVPADDYPSMDVSGPKDYQFTDSVYVDDQFEMYVLYFAGSNPGQPLIQRPLGKLAWRWGGLVVFDWDANLQDASHKIRYSVPPTSITGQVFSPSMQVMSSMVTMNGNVEDLPKDGGPCPGGPGLTNNPIDSAREFVKYHYLDFLRRDPTPRLNDTPPYPGDPRGWNFWTSNISQCVFDLNCIHVQRVHTGLGFFYSDEFMRRITAVDPVMANGPGTPAYDPAVYNREFVYWCYIVYLHRPPDDPGWDFWTNDLNRNNDYFHLIDSFQLCTAYRDERSFE